MLCLAQGPDDIIVYVILCYAFCQVKPQVKPGTNVLASRYNYDINRAKLKIRFDRVEGLGLLRRCEIKLNSQIEKPLLLLVPDEISGGVSGQADYQTGPHM